MTYKFLLFCSVTSLSLAACGGGDGLRKQLGVEREAPDAFAVVTRAPLEVPPDYTIRPPRPGAQRPMEIQPAQQAKQTVFGKQSTEIIEARSIDANSSGAQALLQQAGVGQSDPNIRDVLIREDTVLNEDQQPTANKLLFWREGPEQVGEALDPVEELNRIKNTKSEDGLVTKRNEDLPLP